MGSAPCGDCGLKRWDADGLVPGDHVCTCEDPGDVGDLSCPCGGDCWDRSYDPGPTVETTTAFQEAGLL